MATSVVTPGTGGNGTGGGDINAANRELRNQGEAKSFNVIRNNFLENGGYAHVQAKVMELKAEATGHLTVGRTDVAVVGYLMAIHMCVGGEFPTTCCPATAPTPKGEVLVDAIRTLRGPADGVEPAALVALQLNLALCCLKKGDWAPAAVACEYVVDEAGDAKSRTKARLRLSKAYSEQGRSRDCERVLRRVLEDGRAEGADDPAKKAAREAHASLRLLLEKRKKKKADFSGMFASKEAFYSEADQKRERKHARKAKTAREQADMAEDTDKPPKIHTEETMPSSADMFAQLAEEVDSDDDERRSQLACLSPEDAKTYVRMETAGADECALTEFYTVSRRRERNRVAAAMNHEQRDRFQHLLAAQASHEELDACFDEIKRHVDGQIQAKAVKKMMSLDGDDDESLEKAAKAEKARKARAKKAADKPRAVKVKPTFRAAGAEVLPAEKKRAAEELAAAKRKADDEYKARKAAEKAAAALAGPSKGGADDEDACPSIEATSAAAEDAAAGDDDMPPLEPCPPPEPIPADAGSWRYKPVRKQKVEKTEEEKREFQESIDRQVHEAGLDEKPAPAMAFLLRHKARIVSLYVAVYRHLRHTWVVFKDWVEHGDRPLDAAEKKRRARKLAHALSDGEHSF